MCTLYIGNTNYYLLVNPKTGEILTKGNIHVIAKFMDDNPNIVISKIEEV